MHPQLLELLGIAVRIGQEHRYRTVAGSGDRHLDVEFIIGLELLSVHCDSERLVTQELGLDDDLIRIAEGEDIVLFIITEIG